MNQQFLNDILPVLKFKKCVLIAVTKTHPLEILMEAYNAGLKNFGENKVQEMTAKYEMLPKDINWHMIGHLQSNKVKYIAPFVTLIHSVDSINLLEEINKQAGKNNRKIDCLLQIYIAKEETKFGLDESEALAILTSYKSKLKYVRITGLMGMASNVDNDKIVREEFKKLNIFFQKAKMLDSDLKQLSIGMSGDYKIAIEEGSTMVRIGSAIFGNRNSAV